MKKEDDFAPHVIILPSYAPVAICLTKDIAESMAKDRGYKEFRVQKATLQDVNIILEGYFSAKVIKNA